MLPLPLEVSALNAARWTPSRSNGSSRLSHTRLQLAPGTLVVLDETVLAAGQLHETGIGNLQVGARVAGSSLCRWLGRWMAGLARVHTGGGCMEQFLTHACRSTLLLRQRLRQALEWLPLTAH